MSMSLYHVSQPGLIPFDYTTVGSLAQGKDMWRALVDVVMKLRVS